MAITKLAGNVEKAEKKTSSAKNVKKNKELNKDNRDSKELNKVIKELKEGNSVKKILFVSSESAPFITTGGLGEVVGSLPKNLMEQDENIDVRIVLPLYEEVAARFKDRLEFVDTVFVDLGWRHQYCGIFTAKVDKVTYYFVDNEYYFKRADCYGHFDDGERFAFFGKAVLDILEPINFIPDVIHMHDWQSAITAIYLKTTYAHKEAFQNIKTVFTVHNIEYQGKYSMSILWDVFDIPYQYKHILEFDGGINLMKGAMMCCDIISTVSPTYANEIHDYRVSHGLDPIINMQTAKVRGILNGIDTESYNPATDEKVFVNYSAEEPSKKIDNKLQLQTIMNLPAQSDIPVIGVITRLVGHKGIDLITGAMNELVHLPVQFVILGSGERGYELSFESFQERFPEKIAIKIGFNNELARRIYAGADMLLMPSKSEPCGISQMIAARYGTVPLVRETGGLKDSIVPYETDGGKGIGFTFSDYTSDNIVEIINRAVAVYREKGKWDELVKRVMGWDFSWGQSAKEYLKMYGELLGQK